MSGKNIIDVRTQEIMIPYFELHTFSIGPVTLQFWGTFVALGILAGFFWVKLLAEKQKLDVAKLLDILFWAIIGGFITARIAHFLFYSQSMGLWDFFKIWEPGWSSLGGMIGGAAIIVFWLRRLYGSSRQFWSSLDILITAAPIAFFFGRLGCASVHDHLGKLSTSLLAINFPGGARLDMGFLEAIVFLILAVTSYVFLRIFKDRPGLSSYFVVDTYLTARFVLDFFRATDLPGSDPRIFYLTPAQIMIIMTYPFLIWGLVKMKKSW
ncbi:MAG: prolipoprotein diacylglyceryl transferase family protein [bacterium]